MSDLLNNLLHPLPVRLEQELFEELLRGRSFRLERIVSTGQATPPGEWYDQPLPEWVALLSGRARVLLLDPRETREMQAGDVLLIPAHRRHRVEWTEPDRETIWLALHFEEADPPAEPDFPASK